MHELMHRPQRPLTLIALAVVVVFFHVINIGGLPKGLYLDETSIGLNAALIAQTGRDEYDQPWPIYFRAFGENKNPIYIYASAAIFKLTGISETGLRMTSFVFYILGLVAFMAMVRRLWPEQRQLWWFALLGFGFLPQFFALSRISFEVISQLTWLAASYYLIWLCFEGAPRPLRQRMLLAAVCGLVLGTSIYTYSTARLLSALLCLSLGVIYLNRRNFPLLVVMGITTLISLIPYGIFSLNNPGGLTGRFLAISYLDDPIPWLDKLILFVRNYGDYWSPRFLLFKGDYNLRHAIGYGGMVFVGVWLLAIVGLAELLLSGAWRKRFNLLLLVNMAFAPLAAAMTNEGTPHALRSLPVGFFVLTMACYGFAWLQRIGDLAARKRLTQLITGITLFEVGCYLFMYFVFFPERSIQASESYDTRGALQAAVNQQPQRIYFYQEPGAAYANARFYEYLLNNPAQIPVEISRDFRPAAGECVVYYRWVASQISRFGKPVFEQSMHYRSSWLATRLGVSDKDHIARVRCY